jgi:hypothetical protein
MSNELFYFIAKACVKVSMVIPSAQSTVTQFEARLGILDNRRKLHSFVPDTSVTMADIMEMRTDRMRVPYPLEDDTPQKRATLKNQLQKLRNDQAGLASEFEKLTNPDQFS